MEKPRLVAILDQLTEEEFRNLEGADTFDIICCKTDDAEHLKQNLSTARVFWVSLRLRVTEELLRSAPDLQVILTNSTGTDHLDLEAIRKRGITVISLKQDTEFLRQITATAELAFGLMLACSRRFPECIEATRRGEWPRHALRGNQLGGKTLGIIGVGRLGTIVSEYARAFRMRILGHDPWAEPAPEGVVKTDLSTLFAESDLITLHVHLNDSTRHMIGKREFAKMKPGVILVNTSRGGLIDEAALIEAMESGIVGSAGLDVIDGEWMEDKHDHPLIAYSRKNPRLLITPHIGGTCPEAGRMSCAHSMRKLAAFFNDADGPTLADEAETQAVSTSA